MSQYFSDFLWDNMTVAIDKKKNLFYPKAYLKAGGRM